MPRWDAGFIHPSAVDDCVVDGSSPSIPTNRKGCIAQLLEALKLSTTIVQVQENLAHETLPKFGGYSKSDGCCKTPLDVPHRGSRYAVTAYANQTQSSAHYFSCRSYQMDRKSSDPDLCDRGKLELILPSEALVMIATLASKTYTNLMAVQNTVDFFQKTSARCLPST